MLTKLFSYMESLHPLSDACKTYLNAEMKIREYPKRTNLLSAGQVCNHINVVVSGLMRMYYLRDSEEVCSRFMEEGHMAMSVISFYRRVPSYEFIETLTPVVVAEIHFDKLQDLYLKQPEFNFLARRITEEYFIRSEERPYLLRKHNAEERYLYFMEHHPQLLQKIPLKYIASYLGITIETLSRIRSKIRE